ncbi:coupling factor for flagellin transcription and translation [Alkalihalobacillus sp. LMS39]|uniref:DUF6115 domain-containing protein n=1 Tax=Alkalihalobacillus sp. LMS39 TaxID=2924032 RepID=UPI001FB37A47|nr:coupling factor for flagellin transcription and translation [Alkalihalobacillus sp. LMS39]UOE92815.1 coupling factor for flagellin transcription and translation [Alkalihalobacillus sp. LMS39]
MTAYLLTISFIVHLFTILWIITLIQKLNAKESPIDSEKVKQEIEDLLIAYTTEMKEENEKLAQQLRAVSTRQAEMVTPSYNQNIYKEQTPTRVVPTTPKARYEGYTPPVIEEEKQEEIYEQSDTAKVLALAKQGWKAEEIAKKLQLGKVEVELMLKFNQ